MEQLDDFAKGTLENVAEQFDVKADKLWKMYLAVAQSNFIQDLWDVAKENLEELKEMSKGE